MFKERKIKKLEAAARKGKADEVAKLLDKLEYEHLAQLLQPAWWGTEAADLKTGLRLVEDLCNLLPDHKQDLSAAIPAFRLAILKTNPKKRIVLKKS